MNKITINIPEGCKAVTKNNKNGDILISFNKDDCYKNIKNFWVLIRI